jgi:tetratricopeptide (TPR) repeat protein
VGEPGVGKSRLRFEFRRLLAERDVTYLEGWCLSFGQSTPYLPLQDVLRTSCGIAASDSPSQIAQRLRAVLQQAGLAHDELAPYLLQALGVNEGSEAIAQISPETVKARTLDTLLRLALAQSAHRMLVLAIEDLHWIDRTSEEFLTRLIDNLDGARILLVTTTRPGYTPPWLGRSYVTQVPVRVLPPEAARRILDAVTQTGQLSESTTASILRKAEGNPFFLEELSLALREHGGLDAAHGLPDTIQGVIAARIDRLPEPAKRVLQTASVLGREFPLRLLEAMAESPETMLPLLDSLRQFEFFYRRTDAEDAVFVFKHALTQDVAYDSLLTARKEALHEAAGRATEALFPGRLEQHYEMLAHHYSHSSNAEKAIEYLEHANLKALKANAMEGAQAYFHEALRQYSRLVDTPERRRARVAVITRQAPVFMLQMKMVEYEALLRQALADAEATGDEGLLGQFLACLGHCHWFSARYDEAIETNLRAAELSRRSGVFDGAGHGLMLVQWSQLYAGAFERVLEVEPQALDALDRAPHLRYRLWSLTASSQACANMGRWADATERACEAMRLGEAVSDVSLIAFGAWIIAIAYVQKGDLDQALHFAQLSVDKAPTLGDKAWGRDIWLWATVRRGERDVLAEMEQNWGLFQATGFKGLIAMSGNYLAEAYLRAGRFHDAEQTAAEVSALCEACGQRFWEGVARRLGAEAIVAQTEGRRGEARAQFDRAIDLLHACKAEPDLAHALAGRGRLNAMRGDAAPARADLMRALEIYQRLDMQPGPGRVRAELAALDRPR